jgi:hypothetical protein
MDGWLRLEQAKGYPITQSGSLILHWTDEGDSPEMGGAPWLWRRLTGGGPKWCFSGSHPMRLAPTRAVQDGELTKGVSERRRGLGGSAQQWRGGIGLRRGHERALRDNRCHKGAKRVQQLLNTSRVVANWCGKSPGSVVASDGGT